MTLELPRESKITITLGFVLVAAAIYSILTSSYVNFWIIVSLFFVSGFLADIFTAFFHFGFDYVFPYSTPVLGPISRSFRIHHDDPDLDPSSYIENLTRGAQASIPLALISLLIPIHEQFWLFYAAATLAAMSIWGIFFHQIHSYCHMGAHLQGAEFIARVAEIEKIETKLEQKRALNALFKDVPIPGYIRLLQRARIILNPSVHNLHHIHFESDFSSVNGWSDWLTNPILRPLARRYKLAAKKQNNQVSH